MTMKKRKKFVSYKCENCDRCMTECAVRHSKSKNMLDAITETPPPMARLLIDMENDEPVMSVCQNCGKPKCIAACEFNAISVYPDGNVVIDQSQCVGCWACVQVCPFSSIFKDEKAKVAVNCDNCVGFDDLGCVNACPVNAIVPDEEPVDVELCRL